MTGRFLPSYAAEAAEWCEATEHIVFHRFSPARLQDFWDVYRQDPTYNLTNRNCSIAVALALDAALEGVLGRDTGWPRLLRLATHPDLHLATLLRKRGVDDLDARTPARLFPRPAPRRRAAGAVLGRHVPPRRGRLPAHSPRLPARGA